MEKLTIDDIELRDKKVLVRVDFNVPLNEKAEVTDDKKIVESLPTIKKILQESGKAILMSHLGRPKGNKMPEMSLSPVAKRLEKLLKEPVKFVEDCIGPPVEKAVSELKSGECLLLENLRFYVEEEKNDPEFAKRLASLGEIYINDAFGTTHRAHASTEGVTKYLKQSGAGYLGGAYFVQNTPIGRGHNISRLAALFTAAHLAKRDVTQKPRRKIWRQLAIGIAAATITLSQVIPWSFCEGQASTYSRPEVVECIINPICEFCDVHSDTLRQGIKLVLERHGYDVDVTGDRCFLQTLWKEQPGSKPRMRTRVHVFLKRSFEKCDCIEILFLPFVQVQYRHEGEWEYKPLDNGLKRRHILPIIKEISAMKLEPKK